MKISNDGLAIVKVFEGLRLKAYRCAANVLTIGYGSTGKHVKPGMVITEAQADELLRKDIERFERHVEKNASVPLEQHEFDALVSWAFNTGGPAHASLWRELNAGNKNVIPAKLAAWNKGGGRVLKGLVRRREAEGLLWQGRIAAAFEVAGVKGKPSKAAPVAVAAPAPPTSWWQSLFGRR